MDLVRPPGAFMIDFLPGSRNSLSQVVAAHVIYFLTQEMVLVSPGGSYVIDIS